MGYVDDRNLMNALSNFKVRCKHCGRKITFVSNREKIICLNCGKYIYKNKKLEFKDKLLKEREKNK